MRVIHDLHELTEVATGSTDVYVRYSAGPGSCPEPTAYVSRGRFCRPLESGPADSVRRPATGSGHGRT
jgi:hypothetical protein